jgi:hypothetical protein
MAPPAPAVGRRAALEVIGDQHRYRLPRVRPEVVTLRYHPFDLR